MISAYDIQRYVERLPAPLKQEALDFVAYPLQKAENEAARQEETDWSTLSLSAAMRNMEHEDASLYATADLKEVFS